MDDSLDIKVDNESSALWIDDPDDKYSSNRKRPKLHHCHLCPKSYTSKSSVKFHIETRHIKPDPLEKTHPCAECDKAFVCLSSLRQHMKLKHLVGDIYRCHFCGKSFNTKPDVTRHLRTHTGDRPFKCPLCEKSFTCKSSLKTHLKNHIGKSISCSYCDKKFNVDSDRVRHESIHTGQKPWRCLTCGKSYSCKSTVKVHIRTAHLSSKKGSKRETFETDHLDFNIDEHIEYKPNPIEIKQEQV